MTMLYFAYGSNMDRATMAVHCPGAKALGPARLPNHRFFIARAGYASIAPRPGAETWGVLWEVSERDLPALDAYENVAGGLYRRATVAVRHDEKSLRAVVYIARDGRPGRPRPSYQEQLVLKPAREWGFPRAYCDALARFAGAD
jgi:gamma-glutamylcyclotransferase (GGCT)/AIG2-like uncharacterized protein YtfP